MLSSEVVGRFCQSMKTQRVGKILAEPRMVTLSGRPATFLSGGQAATNRLALVEHDGHVAPELETTFSPFGTLVTFLPLVKPDGVYVECDCELSTINGCKEYKVTIESTGEEPRTETMRRTVTKSHKVHFAAMPPVGRAMLMHCGRDAQGQDVIVSVTPYLVNSFSQAFAPVAAPGAMPMDRMEDPTFPIPLGHPVCNVIPTCVAPSRFPELPCSAVAPPPPYEPQLVTGQFTPAPSETKLDRLMAKYRKACSDGDAAKARKVAKKCMAIDPTCFGK
jgi:hypothetical protein